MEQRAIKYRIYPTPEQAELISKTFGCCRKVYNLMLEDKIRSYEAEKKFVQVTPAKYKEEYPFLKEVDSLALANKQLDLEEALRNFYRKNCKFPKFKAKKQGRQSYTTNNQNGTVDIIGNGVRLPKLGIIKAVIHRMPEEGWALKSATVSRETDGSHYVSVLFSYEKEACEYVPDTSNAVGLDYASDCLYIDSNGNEGSNHKFFRESQTKLAKEQRRLSKKVGSKKGTDKSKNYFKQLKKVNKIHRHIANQRLDNLHKLSAGIANRYDVVCVESLNMRAMANKGFGNGKATLDNGYGMFLRLLEYKLEDRNKYFVKVDKWFPSSQICHKCGYRNESVRDLSIREWECPCCHEHHNRDVNAAINILHEGLRILRDQA